MAGMSDSYRKNRYANSWRSPCPWEKRHLTHDRPHRQKRMRASSPTAPAACADQREFARAVACDQSEHAAWRQRWINTWHARAFVHESNANAGWAAHR